MIFILFHLGFASNRAILFCGSQYMYNYRHQADIYTIYQQLISRGFSPKDITVFSYDDVVDAYENPIKGQMFHTVDHIVNVYPGINAINYRRSNTSAKNLYNTMTSLSTTPEDNLFIYFNDHGGPGYLSVPDTLDNAIFANDLVKAFDTMYANHLFNKCLFMIEACYSGSIGKLITTPSVAVITASNDIESSNAAVYDESLETWITNEFTNNFIFLIDENPQQTIGDLYESLKSLTTGSHASYYGDETIKSLYLQTFIGSPKSAVYKSRTAINLSIRGQRDASEKTLQKMSLSTKNPQLRAKARLEMLKRKTQTEKISILIEMLVNRIAPDQFDLIMNDKTAPFTSTYFQVIKLFSSIMGEMNPDDSDKFFVLKALATKYSFEDIRAAISPVI